jgi:hypothetical protein
MLTLDVLFKRYFGKHIATNETLLWKWGTEKGFRDPYNIAQTNNMITLLGRNGAISEGGNRSLINSFLYQKYNYLNNRCCGVQETASEKDKGLMRKRRNQRSCHVKYQSKSCNSLAYVLTSFFFGRKRTTVQRLFFSSMKIVPLYPTI